MVQLSRSAKLYQERRIPQDRRTMRRPGPRISLEQHPTQHIPLAPPFPSPEVKRAEQPSDPDSPLTLPWPHGADELR